MDTASGVRLEHDSYSGSFWGLRRWLFLCILAGGAFVLTFLKQEPSVAISSFNACILGCVQGVTEFLPVSSSGHLILTMRALGLTDTALVLGSQVITVEKLADTLCVIFQGASALAVLVVLRKRLIEIVFSRPLGWKPSWTRLVVATAPAAGLGFLLMGFIKSHLFGIQTVAWSVLFGGLFMGAVALWQRRRPRPSENSWEKLSSMRILGIGCLQCLALCPGMSRSMTTLTGGVWVGLSWAQALELSLLLGAILVLGTAAYSLLGACAVIHASGAWEPLFWGSFLAFICALAVIRLMLSLLERYGLGPFAVYRILLGLILIYWSY